MTTNNYLKVTRTNGSGLDTLGTFFFDDRDPTLSAEARRLAEECARDSDRSQPRAHDGTPRHKARIGVWRHTHAAPYTIIGETS